MSKETYLKVGGYTPETEDTEAVIDRDYYRQGWIFKDEEAFLHYPDKVCYVPELSDEGLYPAGFSGYGGRAEGICPRVLLCGGLAAPGNMDRRAIPRQ